MNPIKKLSVTLAAATLLVSFGAVGSFAANEAEATPQTSSGSTAVKPKYEGMTAEEIAQAKAARKAMLEAKYPGMSKTEIADAKANKLAEQREKATAKQQKIAERTEKLAARAERIAQREQAKTSRKTQS